MERWHYDPNAYLDPVYSERLRFFVERPGPLITKMRCLAAAVLRSWLRVYNQLTIIGRENLPLDRSCLIVANHSSHLDTLCLLSALPMRRLHRTFPAAAEDYFCVSRFRAFLARVVVNALPFDRRFSPWRSLSTCSQLLEQPGNILIFFPEGTRSSAAEPGEFKPGAALLAAGRDIPVVPCHLAGTHAALPKGSWLPRPRTVRLTIGRPRVYAHLPPTKESARLITQELREAIIELGQHEATAIAKTRLLHSLQLESP